MLRIKLVELYNRSRLAGKTRSLRSLAIRAEIPYPTIYRMMRHPDRMRRIDLPTLSRLLSDGLGMGQEEILDFERGASASELGENWRSPNWHGRRQF